MTHPPTEAQAPTPEPSEEDREFFLRCSRVNVPATERGYRIIGFKVPDDRFQYLHEGIDALVRALSPSPDTRMGEVSVPPMDEALKWDGKVSYSRTLAEEVSSRQAYDLGFRYALATTRLAASSREGGEMREACEGALQWMERLADRFESEWPNTSAHCRIHVNTLRAALSTSAGEKGGGIAQMQRALVDHNDALRSAAQVANRDGADTNWLTFRGHVHRVLAEHHETTSEARAALGSAKESGE